MIEDNEEHINEYESVIGLEVHAELSTKTKIYCSCRNVFGGTPNTNVCPICMGLPGALPSLNKKVVEYAVKAGIAMNCHINNISGHDRKNYFYPDLPKAYQISQWETPICENGYLDIVSDGRIKRIGINRIHIEEDAGKLLHESEKNSLADFNRCGVPLIEIVSEPDMNNSSQAKAYLETIKMILQYIGVSDCKMQEGSIRCDVNVSLRKKGSSELGTRCELKNVNSFSGAIRGIEYEILRQTQILKSGGVIEQETRRWDDASGKSIIMRTKENAQDYRYFPEPDLKAIVISDYEIEKLKETLPELPNKKIWRYINEYGFSQIDAELIVESIERAELFDKSVTLDICKPKNICNWILSDIAKIQNETGLAISDMNITANKLCTLISEVEKGNISNTTGKTVLSIMVKSGKTPLDIIKENNMIQNSDRGSLRRIVCEVLSENQKSVNDYKNGKEKALGFIVGKCMQKSKGTANPSMLREIILSEI